MRSAERLSLVIASAALLAGCGSVKFMGRDNTPPKSTYVDTAAAPTAAAPTAAASAPDAAPATKAAASVAASPRPASTGPIAPATQRAYDDALALLRAGHPADAEKGFRALTQSDPDLAGPHANLGLLARQAGRLPEAVSELEKATTLAPGLTAAWNQLGLAYRQSGEFTKAREAYEHALALDPNYATAALNLGVLEDLYLAEPAKALELYTRYLALTPGGDPVVAKWVADVKNRKPAPAAAASAPAGGAKPAAAPASTAAPAKAPKEKS